MAPTIWAGGETRTRGPEARVVLYQDADFRGASRVIYPGESIDNFSGQTFSGGGSLNDRVSSIRIEGGAEVYVYDDARFRGAAMRLTESVRNLTGRLLTDNGRDSWNDRISSVKVEQPRRRPGGEREVDYNAVIKRAYQDLLGRDPDESGLRTYRGLMIDQGWTEKMVREHVRQGDESVDRVVHRAYQDVLGREADPSGLKQYRKMIREKEWTEGDVRDDLRRSTEFKNRPKTAP